MRDFEQNLRNHRLRKRYYLTVVFGRSLLDFFSDSYVIKEEMAIAYYWLKSLKTDQKISNLKHSLKLILPFFSFTINP